MYVHAELERLRWRIWNGKAKNAQRSINRICKVMHVFKGENSHRTKSTSISVAKVPGWSITPNDIVLVGVSGPRSPKARRTSWPIGG